MGLLNFFGRGPLSPGKIAKIAKLAANPFAQPDVRMREMERLLEDGSELALQGLLRRLTCNAQGHIADEEEKQWLEDALVGVGRPAVAPLQAYIRQENKLTIALRALERIVGRDPAARFFVGVLQAHGPENHRQDEAKLQLVLQLVAPADGGTPPGPAPISALLPFLRDHSDDIRWAVLEALHAATGGDPSDPAAMLAPPVAATELLAAAAPWLQQQLGDPQCSARIARRAAQLMALHRLNLPPPARLPAEIEDQFWLDKAAVVRRRAQN